MTTIIKHDRSPTGDIKKRWNSRNRVDRQVTGAIELAYLRGKHAGYVEGYKDAKKRRKPRYE